MVRFMLQDPLPPRERCVPDVGMESLSSLNLLLLPSSIGLLDLLLIHKILDTQATTSPPSISHEEIHNESPLMSAHVSPDSLTPAIDSPQQIMDNSFISDGYPSPQPEESSYSFSNEDNSHRAPCPLPLISKTIRRKLTFSDDNFSQWFLEVRELFFFAIDSHSFSLMRKLKGAL